MLCEVGIDATIGESLLLGGAVVNEGIVGEVAIDCMVVLDIDKMVCPKLLESKFGLDGFIA